MYVRHLSLVDFRNYPSAELELSPGITILLGRNGQGKTNLVEAIGYLAGLSSHRVATDAPLVRAGTERAIARAAVVRGDREVLVEVEITPGRANRARLNRAPVKPRDVLGYLRTVLFAPEDLALVKGDPEGRRRFLDELLILLAPRFAGVRADYDRALRQRNTLLRQSSTRGGRRGRARVASAAEAAGATVEATLDVWDGQLAQFGADLLAARLFLVQRLGPLVADAYRTVSGGAGEAVLSYRGSLEPVLDLAGAVAADATLPTRAELSAAIAERFTQVRSAELERGQTLVGPHRDDLVLNLGDLPAKGYASHGESWSFALALRLAGFELLRRDDDGGDPVLILDDVFAELDAGRRDRLAAAVRGAQQVIVTAAVAEDVPAGLTGGVVHIGNGRIGEPAGEARGDERPEGNVIGTDGSEELAGDGVEVVETEGEEAEDVGEATVQD